MSLYFSRNTECIILSVIVSGQFVVAYESFNESFVMFGACC